MIYEQTLGNQQLTLRLNGGFESQMAVTNEYVASERSVSLGGRSSSLSSEYCFNGEVSEVLIYDRMLQIDERVEVVNYLKSKWFLASEAVVLPPVVRGLRFMCDAGISDSLTTNGSGRVSQWNDPTGNGFATVQSIDSRKPVYTPDGINGHPSLIFNGSNVLMSASSFVNYSNHTIFVVAQATDRTFAGNDLFGSGDTTPGSVIIISNLRNDYQATYFTEGTRHVKAKSIGGSTLSPAVYEQWLDDSDLKLYLDGQPLGSTPVPGVHTNTLKKVCLGNRKNSDPNGNGFIGIMSEVLVYDCALTVEERQLVETYLYEKWIMPIKGTIILLH